MELEKEQAEKPTLEFTIPQDALLELFRLLALDGVSFADYAVAVGQLISELLERQLLLRPYDAGTRTADDKGTQGYTENIDAVFQAAANRLDKSVR